MVESDQASRNATVADPLIGKVLSGRFRVLEKLGAGGMGTVYKAVQTPLDRVVALKVLNQNYDSRRDPGFQRRFFLEASVTSKLKHPNTITVIDYGKTDDGIYYIAMEYVEGITLAQVLTQEGTLPSNRVLHIGQQIARSLREAHKSGIIHRDLKPANVMICNEETDRDLVKVLDFGLVKSFLSDSPHAATEGADITQAGVFLGSPQYMAPEQARNLADPRSDIYSLGVVMYQMLIGQPPFQAEQSIDVIVKHMKEAPKPFGAARPDLDIPGEVEALVMKCLSKNPDKRYQSMDELLEAMRRVAQGTGMSGAFSGSRTPAPMSQSGAHRVPQSGPQQHVPPGSGAFRTPPGQSGVRSQAGLNRSGSGAHRVPGKISSGAHKAGSGAQTGSGAYRATTTSLEIPLDSEVGTESDVPAASMRSRKLLPLWIFLGSVALGTGGFFLIPRSPPAQQQRAPSTPPPPVDDEPLAKLEVPPDKSSPPAAVAPHAEPVLVHVRTLPAGATVLLGSKPVGLTPMDLPMTVGPNGQIADRLTLSLSGYVPETVVPDSDDVFRQLRRKSAASPVKPKKPTGNNKDGYNKDGYKEDPYQ